MSVIVTMNDCTKLKYCAVGVKKLFKRYNLDFKDFLINGIDSDILETTIPNNAMVKAAIGEANGRIK